MRSYEPSQYVPNRAPTPRPGTRFYLVNDGKVHGICTLGRCFRYAGIEAFNRDSDQHQITDETAPSRANEESPSLPALRAVSCQAAGGDGEPVVEAADSRGVYQRSSSRRAIPLWAAPLLQSSCQQSLRWRLLWQHLDNCRHGRCATRRMAPMSALGPC